MRKFIEIWILTVLFTANGFATSELKWEKFDEEDGITVYRADIKNSPIVAFRGIGEIETSIMNVTSILSNTDRKLHWVAKIKEAKLLRTLGTYEVVEYNHTNAPWPIQDRDFVFKAQLTPSKDWKQITIEINSTTDDLMPPKKSIVRGEILQSKFVLTQISPNKTKVQLEILADPKGLIPKWLANIFQKQWPLKTLQNMRKEAARKEFAVHPRVAKLFNKQVDKK